MGYILILPTILMRITIICVGVECDNLCRRGMRFSVKSDTKRIWAPYQEISCDAELYAEFEFNLCYSAHAFFRRKNCVGESKNTHFELSQVLLFESKAKPDGYDSTLVI